MSHASPDSWLYSDWLLIARALRAAKDENCRCYDCDTLDSLIDDIAWYWDLDTHELLAEATS